jgi:hypothetical protein
MPLEVVLTILTISRGSRSRIRRIGRGGIYHISYLGPHGMPLEVVLTILTISSGSSRMRMMGGIYTRTVFVKHGVN